MEEFMDLILTENKRINKKEFNFNYGDRPNNNIDKF